MRDHTILDWATSRAHSRRASVLKMTAAISLRPLIIQRGYLHDIASRGDDSAYALKIVLNLELPYGS